MGQGESTACLRWCQPGLQPSARSQMGLALFPSDPDLTRFCLFHVLCTNSPLSPSAKDLGEGERLTDPLLWDSARILGFCQNLLPNPLPRAGTHILQQPNSTGTLPWTLSLTSRFPLPPFPASLAADESLQEAFPPFASGINLKPRDHCTDT